MGGSFWGGPFLFFLICVFVCFPSPLFLPEIHTLQEANLAFLPYESKAFTLDYQDGFHRFYSESSMGKVELVDRIADQLATVCAMLGEYPSVRYRE